MLLIINQYILKICLILHLTLRLAHYVLRQQLCL
nr:MAG TPA: hypothetical protein [Caudoviricetes sp.]DAR51626.1 MAG TPA: hypothetical protein [Caudoviricetes sp.]